MSEAAVDERPSTEDVVESLTGFDEIAIAQAFKKDMGDLTATMTLRALAFVLRRREGVDDKTAYGDALRMTLKECTALFAEDEETGDAKGKG